MYLGTITVQAEVKLRSGQSSSEASRGFALKRWGVYQTNKQKRLENLTQILTPSPSPFQGWAGSMTKKRLPYGSWWVWWEYEEVAASSGKAGLGTCRSRFTYCHRTDRGPKLPLPLHLPPDRSEAPGPICFRRVLNIGFLDLYCRGGGGRNPYFLHKKSFSSRQGTHQAEGCQLEILKKESERLLLNFAD